jgi:hypothetical protein
MKRMRRLHPRLGWLWLERDDWAATMQRQAQERDLLADPTQSGPAPRFVEWVEQQQLPQLAVRYRAQFQERISDLMLQLQNRQTEIERGRLDLQPEAAQLAGEITKLSELLQ